MAKQRTLEECAPAQIPQPYTYEYLDDLDDNIVHFNGKPVYTMQLAPLLNQQTHDLQVLCEWLETRQAVISEERVLVRRVTEALPQDPKYHLSLREKLAFARMQALHRNSPAIGGNKGVESP